MDKAKYISGIFCFCLVLSFCLFFPPDSHADFKIGIMQEKKGAGAMKGDRERCLEAGMDDYITKPIKREIVFQVLEKWVLKKEPL